MFKHGMSLLTVLLVAVFALTLSACGGGGDQKKAADEPPPFEIHVSKAAQYSDLSGEIPDGQYVVLELKIKNTSNETQDLSPSDFEIRNITNNPDEQYAQGNESGLGGAFGGVYGREKMGQLLENGQSTIHPRMDVERFIVYMLPNDVKLDEYELHYKPYDVKIPLVGPDTEVKDNRQQSNNY